MYCNDLFIVYPSQESLPSCRLTLVTDCLVLLVLKSQPGTTKGASRAVLNDWGKGPN